MVENEEEDW